MTDVDKVMFILYVKDQEQSKKFYENIFEMNPTLHVPGMTEFNLAENITIGIMPGDNIARILNHKVVNPNEVSGVPRCEIYLFVDNPDTYYDKVVNAGGHGISRGQLRNWGDYVSYCSDFDGNILAFAARKTS